MELFLILFVIVGSLALLSVSSDLIVFSLSNYARKIGVSHYLIGFIVLSIGTGLPELVASIEGTLCSAGDIVMGTIIGSNLFKIPLMGASILFASKPNISIKKENKGVSLIILLIAVLPFFLLFDGVLSRFDGFILLIAFLFYVFNLWRMEASLGRIKKSVKIRDIYQEGLIFVISLGVLLLSAQWLVESSINLSKYINLPSFLIGIFVIGIGASAPEIMVQIRSIISKTGDIAFGNIFGSIVVNSSFVLGVVALFKPFTIESRFIIFGAIFTFFCLLMTIIFSQKDVLKRRYGAIMIAVYILYLIFQFWLG